MAERWRPRALVLAGVVVLWASLLVNGQSRARLVNNGYEGVVVGVSPNVREQDGPALVQALKDLFSATSQGLYQATDQRAYFRSVTILIPRSWSSVTVTDPARSESFQNSDIRVDEMNPVYQHQPYTEQTGGCGDPGQFIHLTPSYLLNDTTAAWWGPRDKALLLEWAKLRWGVFDELGYPDDPNFPLFYRESKGRISPTHCADPSVRGRRRDRRHRDECSVKQDGLPDEHCRFIPYKRQTTTSSLMSYPVLMNQQVIHFCGAGGRDHNAEAPTKQNYYCGKRSAWDVISSHLDFKNNANPPTTTFPNVIVKVVQQADANYALVLDYSGSMGGERIQKLRKTARRWLLHEVATGSHVAIINFSSGARLVRGLTKIADDATRKNLANAINTNTDGGTSIGSGLRMAVQTVLANKGNPIILLITDGGENEPPRIPDVLNEVVASGTRVVTVAFGTAADQKLEEVAQKTGGKTFTVMDVDQGQMLQDAFEGALTFQPPPPAAEQTVPIDENSYQINGNEASSDFSVDFTLGRNLIFSLETAATVTSAPILTDPDGQEYVATYDTDSASYMIKVPTAKEGKWRWKVGVSGSGSVQVRVTSQPRNAAVEPITTRAWLSKASSGVNPSQDKLIVYAEVKQGNKPVVNADVRAVVTPPNESDPAQTYELLDNGQGADNTAGDGTYSRYITKYTSIGRYSVKAQVTDGGKAQINSGFLTAHQRRRKRQVDEEDEDEEEEDEEFDEGYENIFLNRPTRCCGSVVPIPKDAPVTGTFERTASGGSFKVTSVPQPNEDVLAPGEVRDLQVHLHHHEWLSNSFIKVNVSLTWTAPGDDLDSGIVSGYELRMTPNISDLLVENFIPDTSKFTRNSTSSSWRVVDLSGLPIDVEAGTRLEFNTSLTLPPTMMYFALRAWDEVKTVSPVSNTASLYVNIPPAKAGGRVPTWAWWWWCWLYCVKYYWW